VKTQLFFFLLLFHLLVSDQLALVAKTMLAIFKDQFSDQL